MSFKRTELSDPNSCLNKAQDDEMIFVLRAKDPCAGIAILAWINARIDQKLNTIDDEKIKSAYRAIDAMRVQRFTRF